MNAVAPILTVTLLALAALPVQAEERGLHLGEEAQAAARSAAALLTGIHRFEFETRKDESLRQVEAENALRRAALAPTGLGIEGSPGDLVRQRQALDRRFFLDLRSVERDLEQVTRGQPGLQRELLRSLDRVEFERRQRQVHRQNEMRVRSRAQQQRFGGGRGRHVTGGALRGAFGRSCRR